jgi:hypothetical protein
MYPTRTIRGWSRFQGGLRISKGIFASDGGANLNAPYTTDRFSLWRPCVGDDNLHAMLTSELTVTLLYVLCGQAGIKYVVTASLFQSVYKA